LQKTELQRSIQGLQAELFKSRTIAKESLDKSDEFERRFHDTDQDFIHLNEATERELTTLRTELITKSDENTTLHHIIEDEKLKRFYLMIRCFYSSDFCF
jgi:hypothetical protein